MARAVSWAAIAVLVAGPGYAANSFVLPDGLSRAPAVTLNCSTDGANALPCGVVARPLVVAPVSGAATEANQESEVTAQQLLLQAVGAQSDGAYGGTGSASMVSLLKALAGSLSLGVPAVPVGGVPVSRSMSVPAQQTTTLFAANAQRRYLAFQVPSGTAIWVNFVGGPAGPSGADCVYFPAGTFYESGSFVNRGSINVYAPVAVTVAAWEG